MINPGADQIVAAVRETSRAMVTAEFDGLRAELVFDPGLCPDLYERANRVMHHLHTSHELTYVDHHPGLFWHQQTAEDRALRPAPRWYDEHNPELQAAIFVNFVHKPDTVHVFREAPKDGWWPSLTCWPEGRCIIGVAANCAGAYGGTVYLLLQRGQFILAFECCGPCHQRLLEIVEGAEILAEADARVAFDAIAAERAAKWRAIRAEQDGEAL